MFYVDFDASNAIQTKIINQKCSTGAYQLQHWSPIHSVEVLYLHLGGGGAGGTISNDHEFIESSSRNGFRAVAVGKYNVLIATATRII